MNVNLFQKLKILLLAEMTDLHVLQKVDWLMKIQQNSYEIALVQMLKQLELIHTIDFNELQQEIEGELIEYEHLKSNQKLD